MDILPGPSGQSFLGEPSGSLDSGQGKILHVMFGRLKAGRWGHGGGAVCEWWSEWVGTKKFMHQIHSHSFENNNPLPMQNICFLTVGFRSQTVVCCMQGLITSL